MTREEKLQYFVTTYAELENNVRLLMNHYASPCCSICQSCCCRYDICEESIEAPFLCLVRELQPPLISFCDSYGWLTPAGCALTVGRPPVCYEFLCDDLMLQLPDDHTRYALRILGSLLTHLGKNAIPKQHLVEIMDQKKLYEIDLATFEKKRLFAEDVFERLEAFFNGEQLSEESLALMNKIIPITNNLLQGP